MNSNWFDFDDDSDFFDKSKVEYVKKNFGLSSRKVDDKNWRHSSEVNDILNVATSKLDTGEKSKLIKSLIKDRFADRNVMSKEARMRNIEDDFFSDVDARVSRIKNRFLNDTVESDIRKRNIQTERSKRNRPERSPSCSSANSYGFTDVTNDGRFRKDSVDSSWSRKSCQGNVTFPTSSTSTISEGLSDKTIGRSISRESDDSVCTEKSINCSTVSEKLPDGTDKTQTENNESWLRKSNSGSKISEKKLNDVILTEKSDDGICEKSSTRMSYLEKSATGSSLQEEMTSERMTSSSKGGVKTVEQKSSSERFKSSSSSSSNKSSYYDDLDSCSFEPFVPFYSKMREDKSKTSSLHRKDLFRPKKTNLVSEKISKLIDEAVQQDDLFKIPSTLQTDIDKMTDDFFKSKSFGGQDRSRAGRNRLCDLFSGTGKDETYVSCSKVNELKTENESLVQENLKLQSIIQDVTAVNKRWQKYNNERRLYVQKLLSTIQDLQEQINLISEKSAFQNKPQEDVGARDCEIENLKKEHREQVTVLELQIKSHKDDWDAERKEKRKALQEKEELEGRVLDLSREVKFLKNVLQEERQRKATICALCKDKWEESGVLYPKMEYCAEAGSMKLPNFSTVVHVPFETGKMSSEECYFGKEDLLAGGQERNPYFTGTKDSFSTSKGTKNLSGDTIVVEDESGIRLSITEQFPSKDGHLKSILKNNDKKNKVVTKVSSGQMNVQEEKKSKFSKRKPPSCKPNITCEEFMPTKPSNYELSLGFEDDDGLAHVTSFTPDFIKPNSATHYLSAATTQLLKVNSQNSKSKSEPNTRSNSSENLKPLRESSSWNNASFGVSANILENIICPNGDKIFPPSIHHLSLQFCPNNNSNNNDGDSNSNNCNNNNNINF